MRRRSLIALALACALVANGLVVNDAGAAIDLGFAKQDGGQAGAFLDFAASARSLGMGRAFTAVSDDAGSTYWNPAGLAQVDRKDLVALYSFLPEDTSYGFASFAQPLLDVGTLGVGLVSLQSGKFERRDAQGNTAGTFSDSEAALLLSHGIRLNNWLSFGSTMKVVRQQVDAFAGTGYGLDFGATAFLSPKWQAALVTRNVLAPKVTLKSNSDTYAREARLGLSFRPTERWLLATDFSKTLGRSVKPYIGAEFMVNHLLAVRAGLNETEIAAGLGFKMRDWGIDYAFGYNDAVAGIPDLGVSHRLGFHWNFGKRITEQLGSERWQRRGKAVLGRLVARMNEPRGEISDDLRRDINVAEQVIHHQGFVSAQDLYTAQGLIYYFEGDFERSMQSLSEALSLAPQDTALIQYLEKARAFMTEEQQRKAVEDAMAQCKDNYNKGSFHAALSACDQVLKLQPTHIEAAAYRDDTLKRINEPIERELKISEAKFKQEEYLDVIKHLQLVKEMDPQNQEAADLMTKSLEALEKQATAAAAGPSAAGPVAAPSPQPQPVPLAQASAEPKADRDPAKSRELYSSGLLLYSQGKLQDATTAWGQAVKFDGTNILARNAYNRAIAELKEKPAEPKQ